MQCLFGDRIPLPTDNDRILTDPSDDANTRFVQSIIFDSQGKTITKAKSKKLLYNRDAKVHSVLMEMMLLKRHNYTDVINMPGRIEEIVKFACLLGICVQDRRNLRRIIDHCSDLVCIKVRAEVSPEQTSPGQAA